LNVQHNKYQKNTSVAEAVCARPLATTNREEKASFSGVVVFFSGIILFLPCLEDCPPAMP
jgi:hypothetical protein